MHIYVCNVTHDTTTVETTNCCVLWKQAGNTVVNRARLLWSVLSPFVIICKSDIILSLKEKNFKYRDVRAHIEGSVHSQELTGHLLNRILLYGRTRVLWCEKYIIVTVQDSSCCCYNTITRSNTGEERVYLVYISKSQSIIVGEGFRAGTGAKTMEDSTCWFAVWLITSWLLYLRTVQELL